MPLGLIVGLVTIVTIIYASAYLQGVLKATSAASGVQLLPFVGGTLVDSVLVGRRVSASGTYRIYPIVGAFTATLGMLVLSRLDVDTPCVAGGGRRRPFVAVAAKTAPASHSKYRVERRSLIR